MIGVLVLDQEPDEPAPFLGEDGVNVFITSMSPTVSPAATASPSDLNGGLSGAGAR